MPVAPNPIGVHVHVWTLALIGWASRARVVARGPARALAFFPARCALQQSLLSARLPGSPLSSPRWVMPGFALSYDGYVSNLLARLLTASAVVGVSTATRTGSSYRPRGKFSHDVSF
jgi:hypothetical protein